MKFKLDSLLDVEKYFEFYFNSLVSELGVKANSEEEMQVLKDEVGKLFSSSLIESAVNVLDSTEIAGIESELELNIEANPFDFYFAVALTKENFKAEIEKNVDELKDQIITLYKK